MPPTHEVQTKGMIPAISAQEKKSHYAGHVGVISPRKNNRAAIATRGI